MNNIIERSIESSSSNFSILDKCIGDNPIGIGYLRLWTVFVNSVDESSADAASSTGSVESQVVGDVSSERSMKMERITEDVSIDDFDTITSNLGTKGTKKRNRISVTVSRLYHHVK